MFDCVGMAGVVPLLPACNYCATGDNIIGSIIENNFLTAS